MNPQKKFNDYFSKQAKEYSLYRPTYPSSIFDYLNTIASQHQMAWDCGTGNGQVALGLTRYFNKVYASDASENQIKNAVMHPKIKYFISVAESTPLESKSIDLITVAQAAHWFNLDDFYGEVKRVLKPQGVLAMWCYGFFEIPQEEVKLKSALQEFYHTINPYWPAERQLIDDQYKTISFPFHEINSPKIIMQKQWNINQLVGYLETWSSTQRCISDRGQEFMFGKLEQIINSVLSPEKLIVIDWPIYWRIGRLSIGN
jgi:ubiquinone/menaquinone biosynthesis C-methylase UbiE